MKVVVLTRNPRGIASRFLARGSLPAGVEVTAVLLDEGLPPDRTTRLRAKARKLVRVGPTAVPVGLALRRVYARAGAGVPALDKLPYRVLRFPTLNGPEARAALRELDPDLALSLDNGLLEEGTFALPRLGTVNVHHGAVPEFRGGPPVFWELVEGRDRVGYTVHGIDRGIDTGPVLAEGDVPIELRDGVFATLAATIPGRHAASLDALDGVLAGLAAGELTARPQLPAGRARTSPSVGDLLRARRQLRARAAARRAAAP
jgi:hypothetical protein